MKAAHFDYTRPSSLEEALEVMAEHGDDCKPLAGGQSLVPLLSMRLAQPALLVDLASVSELRGVVHGDDALRLGAMTRNAELERDPRTPPLLATMLPHVGHFQIRNRGTVGGSLAHLDPAAEWPAIALVLGATLTLASRRGTRSVAMADFMQGPLMTALEPDELLLELTLPLRLEGHGFVEVARRPGDFALVGAVAVRRSGGAASVAVFATGTQPHRLPNLEAQLAERAPVPSEVAKAAASEIQVAGDIHATAGYRRSVGAALVAQAVEQAWKAAPSN